MRALPGKRGAHERRIRVAGYSLAVAFAVMALLLLVLPAHVLQALNRIGDLLGLPPAPVVGLGYYTAIAVAFMYVLAVLAALVAREPAVRAYATVLVHAEAALAVLSLALFALQDVHFVFLASFSVHALVAVFVYVLCLRTRRAVRPQLTVVSGGRPAGSQAAVGGESRPAPGGPHLAPRSAERRED